MLFRRPFSTATLNSRPLCIPSRSIKYERGDMVEFVDYFGALLYSLGIVESVGHGQAFLPKETLYILTASGQYTSKNVNFIRFRAPKLVSDKVQDEKLALSLLENFRDTAQTILKKHHAHIEETIQQQLNSIQDPLSKNNLIYEHDLARIAFGADFDLAKLYSIHLYLHSFTEKYGRDGLYGNWNDQVPFIASGGPYFKRYTEQVQLLQRLRKRPEIVKSPMQFKEYELEDVGRCVIKVATCSWYDSASNPFRELAQQIFPSLDARRPKDAINILSNYNLERHIVNVDLPLSQSGLDYYSPSLTSSSSQFDLVHPKESSSIPNLNSRSVYDAEAYAIDDPSTVEVDDAISWSEKDGKQWIHIHIADPARILYPGTEGDLFARNRVATLYTPQHRFPMLPSVITEQCSLNPNNSRNAAITFSASLSSNGDINDYKVELSIVNKLKRFTYEAVDEMLLKSSNQSNRLQSIISSHHKFRLNQGLININLPKGKFQIYETITEPHIQFKVEKEPSSAHVLVSEAMIIAGRVAAMFSIDHKLSIPFRYHEKPYSQDQKATIELETLLFKQSQGHSLSIAEKLMIIDQFAPSAVDFIPRSHWAMALPCYAQSTSPLRRYFDLVLHQQLHSILSDTAKKLHKDELCMILPSIYRHEQYLKRLSRTSQRFWTVKYMQQLLKIQPNLPVSVTPLSYNWKDGSLQVFFEDFALRYYCRGVSGASELEMGRPHTMTLLKADPLRGELQLGRF